ncbi:Down syndrome cell adhesion molecule precursor, putative [Pediculus humanus corporis]|uniref:Down syndrome cell adhesion molecule, putative n=1 Tax=Pediculus humanus subsp. corporis TaxID=121224 RepID=E0W1A5_PEDHC|nr:Down syndrome cell adhesion molecule precursor, putative [Pediculus humanus corporis]EEB19411.1 Down syndrome cell adhesion molecule precursor, putative [Pediculus humanus corporis]
MLPTGELIIINVTKEDSEKSYKCRTHHRLTQEATVSRNEGKIQLSDMKGFVPPILNKKVEVLTVKEGSTIATPCVAYANPRPTYEWFYKKNQEDTIIVNEEGFIVQDGILVISNVKISNQGTYYCRAKNKEGSEILEMHLVVTAPLSAHVHPSTQSVHLGKMAEFQCSYQGFPITSIYWLKDGQMLRFNSRIRQISDTQIQIYSVSKEDKGMYQCMIKNEFEMKVYPQLLYKFIEQTMQPGPSVSLKCSASGNPTPHISWLLDGFPLYHSDRLMIGQYVTVFGDVVSHVNISSIKTEDGGEYECVAENRAGKTSHSARLNVYGLPYVRTMPSISAVAGKILIIKCPVAGYPIDSVSWEKDGVQLPTSIRQRVINNTLSIENVQKDTDQGSYTCTAKNKQGHSSHKTVQVKVIVPPKITPFTFAHDLKLGDRISVQCVVVSGDLPLSFTWRKDGEPPPESDTITVRRYDPFTSALSIRAIASNHSGNYTCLVSNQAATVSHTAPLRVNVPPYWISEPSRETSVILGRPVSLHCQAGGFPKPSITWKQALGTPEDYRELNYHTPSMTRLENGTLLIGKTGEEHEGYYMCEANNGIGAGKSKFVHLVVHAGPKFKIHSKQEIGKKGETTRLECEVEGDLPMEIIWKIKDDVINTDYNKRFRLKNNTLLKGFMSELTILNVQTSDRGEYVCSAKNSYGQSYMNILLLVQELPGSPKNLHASSQTSRSITVSWLPPITSGDTKISNYILQYKEIKDMWHEHNSQKIINGEKNMDTIIDLKPATVYHFRLYAQNQLGTSPPSDVLQASTKSEPPSGPPLQVSVEPMSPTALRLTWNPPKKNLWNGEILGYNIGIKKLKMENDEYNWTHVPDTSGMPGDFRLTGLLKYTKYLISVRAVNEKGEGPPSEPVLGETMEDVPSEPPQNVLCTALTAQSIQVTWTPPSVYHTHGIIQGYKILYEPTDETQDTSVRENKVVSSISADLHGLQPYTNYSVQVLAFTRAGDGVKSPVVFCTTDESIPEAPSAIKAVVSSDSTVVISWLPPKRSNGALTKYTVYIRVLEQGSETKIIKSTLPAQLLHYEAVGLKKRETYEAWVVASTKIGQGQSTPLVHLVPSATVPASIISFGRVIVVPWKVEVRLPCLFVGQPKPFIEWRFGDVKIQKHSKTITIGEKSLILQNIARTNEGNYSCHVKNNLGSDHIVFAIIVQVPPTSPLLLATSVTSNSVQLQWKQGDNGGAIIRGFILSSKKEGNDWKEFILEPHTNTYLMEGLDCGSNYQIKLIAFNKIGSGLASKLNSITTKGFRPIAPSKEQFVTVNTTHVTLHLQTWNKNGCDLTHFSLRCRQPPDNWFLVFNHLKPQNNFILNDLTPGEEYVVKVTAYNSAGPTSQEYVFSTLSMENAAAENNDSTSFYLETQAIVLGVVSLILLIFAAVGICSSRENICLQDMQTSASFDNTQNLKQREKFYASINKVTQSPMKNMNSLELIPEYAEEICPYATFHLPDQENMAGNPNKSNYISKIQTKHVSKRYLFVVCLFVSAKTRFFFFF